MRGVLSMRIDLHETAKLLENSDNILLLCHAHPDGDTLGSATSLARALQQKGKTVKVDCSDPIPKDFSFMFENLEFPEFAPELIVAVDVADIKLLGRDYEGIYDGRIDLCIDHHGSNMLYADKVCLEPDSASAAEMKEALNAAQIPLYGAALRDDTLDARDVDYTRSAIAIGSEGKGLSREVLELCEKTVKIPMSERCESLNAAIAAAIAMWQMKL